MDAASNTGKSGSLVEVVSVDCVSVKNADNLAGDSSSNGRTSEQEHEKDDKETVHGRMLPGRPPSLQLLLESLRIACQFNIALAFDCLALLGALHRNRSLPIGDLCAACRAQFLIGQERGQFQR